MPTLPRTYFKNSAQNFWDLSQNLHANSDPKKSPIDEFFAYQRQRPDQKVELIWRFEIFNLK